MTATNNNQTTGGNQYLVPGAIIIAGFLIAVGIFFAPGGSLNPQTASVGGLAPGQPRGPAVNIENVDIKGEPFIGKPNAPVTLAYWLDFQCPFCKRFDLQTLSALIKDYVDTGKLKVVFKDFQFLGPDSQTAGLAAKAVWEVSPENYFKWHQAMYEAQDGENSGFGSQDDIIALIREIPGIDADKVAELMEQNRIKYQEEQDADRAEGTGFGINGTPGFVIGTQRIAGAQPTAVFRQVIEAELSK
jgi:protein-disulfide isomerase